MDYAIKIAISVAVLVVAAEVARRSTLLGALVVSLPLTSLLAIVWLWRDTHDVERVARFAGEYTDLSEQDWADAPVQYLTELGVVGGYPDGTFRPNNTVTRAQFAKMLVVAMQWPLQTPANPSFTDVPAGHWAYAYVETAAAHGALAGYPDGTFRPEAGVTRAQVAKMVYVARGWGDAGQADAPAEFVDVSPADWFYNYVRAASVAEIMAGYQDGTFRPNAPATRGQIAKILAVALFSSPSE